MRIVKIEKVKSQRRYVYEIEEKDLMKFGGEHIVKSKLQQEDSEVLDWLEEEEPMYEYEEFEESGDEIYETEWVHEDDEI
jgi:hypothetical protein